MTSVQFERMLSASGPFEGHIIRRSDGKEAKRVAWIQCVGSRDTRCGNPYCSSVCCMVSTKQAVVATDHTPGLKATIFYMDIRAHGKDFDQYYERAQKQGNINYTRSMPSRIMQAPGTKDLRVQYYDEANKLQEQDFDLVVLSVGMEPGISVTEGAKRLDEPLAVYLQRLMDAGLRTLPGTAAEILDDEVRKVLCSDKIDTDEWLDAHRAAHGVGLHSNVTIMFGAIEQPVHWARHIVRTRDLQKETGGFTEFVGLPFVHMASPIYLQPAS